jgi:hypothetical protein
MPQIPVSVIAAASQASPITCSYRLEIAAATGTIAPSSGRSALPPSRSSENAQQKTSITVRTRKLVSDHSCVAAQCAIVGGTPSRSVTPTSTW